MRVILATNNQNKLIEFKQKLKVDVFGLEDLEIDIEIEENEDTLEANALLKAKTIASKFPDDIVIADDSGLFVESLNYAPGVHSKRYSQSGNSEENIDLLLKNLDGIQNRNAFFKTVIAVIVGKEEFIFDGIILGEITETRIGEKGFGYDSVFYVFDLGKTMAQLSLEQKNICSHRGKAIDALIASEVYQNLFK